MFAALLAVAPALSPYLGAIATAAAAYIAVKAGQLIGYGIADQLAAAREQRTVVLSALQTSTFQSLANLTAARSQALGVTMNAQISANIEAQLVAMVNATPLVQTEIDKAKAVVAGYLQDGLIAVMSYGALTNQLDQKAAALAAQSAPNAMFPMTIYSPQGVALTIPQYQVADYIRKGYLYNPPITPAPVTTPAATTTTPSPGSTAPASSGEAALAATMITIYSPTGVAKTVRLADVIPYIQEGYLYNKPVTATPTTPATSAAAAAKDIMVNVAPQINVQVPPTTVIVNTPAPMVNVAPNISVDTTPIGLALPAIGLTLVTALTAAAENIGCGMNRGVVGCQASTGAQLLQTLMKGIAPLGMMLFLEHPQIAERFTDPITKAMFDQLLTIPELGKPVQPGDAPTLARKLFERAVGLGIGAHIAAQVSEASTPMKTLGMGYIAAFLADLAGFSRIAAATMGVLETQALQVPMRYYINQHVRSILPDIRTASEMVGHRKLDQRRFNELLSYHGIPAEFEGAYWAMAFQPATYQMLRAMADAGIWDPVYYREELQDRGFDNPTVQHGLDMLYAMAHGELKPLFTGTAITRYKDGMDDESLLQQNLTMLGVRPELLPKYLVGARLARELAVFDMAQADLKPLFTSTAISRYKDGLDDESLLQQNLTMLGVTPQLLPRYVQGAKLAEDLDDFNDYLAVLKAAVQKGAIDPPDMKDMLVARGMRADRADKLAQLEALRLLPKKKAT